MDQAFCSRVNATQKETLLTLRNLYQLQRERDRERERERDLKKNKYMVFCSWRNSRNLQFVFRGHAITAEDAVALKDSIVSLKPIQQRGAKFC